MQDLTRKTNSTPNLLSIIKELLLLIKDKVQPQKYLNNFYNFKIN